MTGAGDTPRDLASWIRESGKRQTALERRLRGGSVQPGQIIGWAGLAAPSGGYVRANGASLLREDYPRLYEALQDKHGTPVDADHFYVPEVAGTTAMEFWIKT